VIPPSDRCEDFVICEQPAVTFDIPICGVKLSQSGGYLDASSDRLKLRTVGDDDAYPSEIFILKD